MGLLSRDQKCLYCQARSRTAVRSRLYNTGISDKLLTPNQVWWAVSLKTDSWFPHVRNGGFLMPGLRGHERRNTHPQWADRDLAFPVLMRNNCSITRVALLWATLVIDWYHVKILCQYFFTMRTLHESSTKSYFFTLFLEKTSRALRLFLCKLAD